mmetsp:Transcript_58790/g.115619  ORF Transcript_58790/g.115619 Transcript_58790/m.115619 type:complete len:89 (-) Transcript_58790:190-456(-)
MRQQLRQRQGIMHNRRRVGKIATVIDQPSEDLGARLLGVNVPAVLDAQVQAPSQDHPINGVDGTSPFEFRRFVEQVGLAQVGVVQKRC